MARITLQDIAVDRLWLHIMQLRRNVALGKGALVWESRPTSRVQAVLSSIDLDHLALVDRVLVYRLRDVTRAGTSGSLMKAHPLITESHVDQGLVIETSAAKMIHLLALQFVLDALAIRSVANQRENRTNAFHKQSTLLWFCIIQCSLGRYQYVSAIIVWKRHSTNLDTIVTIRIA